MSEKVKIKPFVITLARSKERTDHVLNVLLPQLYENLPSFSKSPIIYDAVDGSIENLNNTLLSRYGINLKKTNMLKGQIGCFLSHYQLWRALNDEPSPSKCYMIFEDDAHILAPSTFWQRVDEMLQEVRRVDPKWKWLYLYIHESQHRQQGGSEKFIIDGCQKIERACVTYGQVAYIISKEGARFLKNHFQDNGLTKASDDSVMELVRRGTSGFFSYTGDPLVETSGQIFGHDEPSRHVIPSTIWEKRLSFPPDCRTQPQFYKETELRQCQLVMTRMLHIFDQILRSFKIPYCIMYGTLLGAIRHSGFVPWDCDVDVAIRSEDLSRVKDILVANIPEDMFFQDKETDPLFDTTQIVKLRDRYSSYHEWGSKNPNKRYQNGLQVDIFPFHFDKDGKRTCHFNGSTEHWPDDWLFDGENELRFEGRWLACPKHINATLKHWYPTLDEPPESERKPHEGKASALIACDHPQSRKWNKVIKHFQKEKTVLPISFYFGVTAVKQEIFLAVERVLTHVRQHYPENVICFFEYESEKLEEIAKRFRCVYLKRPKKLFNFDAHYVYFRDETSHLQMIEDLSLCIKMSGSTWVMKLEPDVLVRSVIDPEYYDVDNKVVGMLGSRFGFNTFLPGVIPFINETSPYLGKEKLRNDEVYSFAGGTMVSSCFLRTLLEKKEELEKVYKHFSEMRGETHRYSVADVDDVYISILCYYFGFKIIDKGMVMETKHTKDKKVLVFAPVVHAYKEFYKK